MQPEQQTSAPRSAEHSIHELAPADKTRWDAFVEQCPEATFFHRAGWQEVIARAFGHRTYYYFAEQAGVIQGVLPLVHVRSLIFGNALISTPFCVYGGIAASDDDARGALDRAAQALARKLNVDYLEYRHLVPRHPEWPTKDLYVTFRKNIDPDVEQNMKNIPRKQRAMVRKGIDAGLQSAIDSGTERFYRAYSESVHTLGTPVFSRRYFEILTEVFSGQSDILTVTKDGRLVGSVLNFYFRNEVIPYYGGGTAEARELKGNDYMYWELMRRSCEKRLGVFDYGRSKRDSGSYSFKKNWGFEPQPLYYEYYLVKAARMPDVSPMNPKFRLFIALWKKLPLAVTQWLGPHIVKYLG